MNCRIAVLAGLFSAAFSLCVGTAVSEELGANRDHPMVSGTPGNASVGVGSQAFRKQTKPYFIEFRARAAQSYGHTFAVYGRVGQKITADQVVGLHPFTESPIPWMAGHLILVPSETGASDGDTEDQYIIARYRILLAEQDYRRLVTHMKQMQASSPVWHAVLYNCNAFVADIAKYMGLKTPFSTLLMPKEFITQLRELNAGAASQNHQITAQDEQQRQKQATAPKPSAPANEGQKTAAYSTPQPKQASARRSPLAVQ
jgi:hypothetical protein